MKKKLFAILTVLSLLFSLTPVTSAAETPVTVIVNGSESSVQGNNLEKLLNVFRRKNDIVPLERNGILTQLAHQRAAELALYYTEERTRPDGSEAISILDGKYDWWTVFDELIAIGPTRAADAMEYWINDPDSRELLLSTAYTDVGISSYEINGNYIWILFLSDSEYGRGTSKDEDKDAWNFVSILPSNLHLDQTGEQHIVLNNGETTTFRLSASNPGWEGLTVPLVMFGYHVDHEEGIIPVCNLFSVKNGNGYVEIHANHFDAPMENTVEVFVYNEQTDPFCIHVTVVPEGEPNNPVPQHDHTPIVLDVAPEICNIPSYTGNTFCAECHFLLSEGENIPYPDHTFSDWYLSEYPDMEQENGGLKWHYCTCCGFTYETWVFENETPHENGHSITVTGTNGSYELSITSARAGHTVFIRAIPDRGYDLAGATLSCSGAEVPELTVDEQYIWFVMPDAPVSVDLSFAPQTPRDVILNIGEGGTASVSQNPSYEGEVITLIITPGEDYEIESVSITGKDGQEPEINELGPTWYQITMPDADVQIDVTFSPVPRYWIDLYTTEGGHAYLDAETAHEDEYVRLTVVPDEGYMIDRILLYTDGTYLPDGNQISETTFYVYMPDGNVIIEVYFVLADNPFSDVKDTDYFYQPVMWAITNSITSGISQTRFGPNNACTRAQVVTFLWAAAGKPEPSSYYNPFTDVKESDYFYKAVLWAVENGITSGMDEATFGSNRPCTRAQVVTFLWAALGRPEPTNYYNPFTDVKETDYYYKAVLFAVEYGITSGMSPTTFGSNNTCTRAHVVTFLYKTFHG